MTGLQPCLYLNETAHVRRKPFARALRYRVFQLFLDIDDIANTTARLRLLTYNRPGLLSFHDADHGDRSGARLRPWAEQAFAAADIALDGGRIFLLCMPRMLNAVFNPLSLYFGYGPAGDLRGVIYEVNNTFGETHAYVAPYRGARPIRAPKRLHVSPFMDVSGDYEFRVRPPGAAFALSILNWRDGAVQHSATLNGRAAPLLDAALARAALSLPLQSVGVMAAIHWEALFIWARGAGYRRKPQPPAERFTPSLRSLSEVTEKPLPQ